MKGQILSRIQSYHTIRTSHRTQAQEVSKTQQKTTTDSLPRFKNSTGKSYQESSCRMGSLGRPNKQGEYIRRSMNRSKIQQIKKAVNYEKVAAAWEPSSKKYFVLPKKLSYRQGNKQEIRSLFPREGENEPNRQNTLTQENQQICSQRSLARIRNIQSSKDLGEAKITSRKDFMKIFNRKQYSKEYLPSACSSSQKTIQAERRNPYDTLHVRVDKLARTTGVFLKQKRQLPYFQLSQKKPREMQSPTPLLEGQETQQNSISPLRVDQQDVSIELSTDNIGEEQKLNSIQEEQEQELSGSRGVQQLPDITSGLELSCSRIEEVHMENDSLFLGSSQRQLLKTMGEVKKGGKPWRKLPSDFLGR